MIAILGGLGAAAAWAGSTLCSSRSSRLIPPPSVVAWMMLVGLVIVAPAAAASGVPDRLDLESGAWLAACGAGNVVGLVLTYSALRIGQVTLVAPVVSTEGAVAAVIAVIAGEPLAPGVALTLGAIVAGVWLASVPEAGAREAASAVPTLAGTAPADTAQPTLAGTALPTLAGTALPTLAATAQPPLAATALPTLAGTAQPPLAGTAPADTAQPTLAATAESEDARDVPSHPTRALFLAMAAALAFGISLYATARAGAELPVSWVVLSARVIGVLTVALPLAVTGRLRLTRRALPLVVASGVCEVLGFYSYTVGSRHGIAVAAVLASQVGGLAALGGYFLFGERISRQRTLGVCTMLAGVAVLSALRA